MPLLRSPRSVTTLAVVSLCLSAHALAFTEAQVAAGLAAYQRSCAESCHQNDLAGAGVIPALRGTAFLSNWNTRPVSELLTTLRGTMPPTNVGGMSEQTYVDLVAFILAANGAQAG